MRGRMKAEQIFELALQYGAEQPGITFDSEALLRYTRKVQEMEREACIELTDSRCQCGGLIQSRGQQ